MEALLVSIKETCHALGLGRTRVYELIKESELKAIKIGRRTLIKIDSIRIFIDSQS